MFLVFEKPSLAAWAHQPADPSFLLKISRQESCIVASLGVHHCNVTVCWMPRPHLVDAAADTVPV